MIEIFALALCSLVLVLYLQARSAAREIRRNREQPGHRLPAPAAQSNRN